MRNYSFRRLTPHDLPLMRRWLQAPHVSVWWPNTARQIALMEQDMTNPAIVMQVVLLGDQPFAYIHDHDTRAFNLPQFSDLPQGTRVMATFVGATEFLGQGDTIGYVDMHVRELRKRYLMVAVGPNNADTRSIGVFTKAGFRKRRLAPTLDDRLVQVMTHL